MNLILASSSPRRKELLAAAGFKYVVDPADIDETLNKDLSPLENVKLLGLKKASALKVKYPNDVILGCDTIVVLDNQIYGKPHGEAMAYQMLETFSGRTHEVISGVAIITPDKTYNFAVTSTVTFKKLSPDDINSYIKTGECFGKAGSYAIQGLGKRLIEGYTGELENIIGLPIKEVKEILEVVL